MTSISSEIIIIIIIMIIIIIIIIIIIMLIAAKSVNFISLHVFYICKFLTSVIVVVPQILIGYLS